MTGIFEQWAWWRPGRLTGTSNPVGVVAARSAEAGDTHGHP